MPLDFFSIPRTLARAKVAAICLGVCLAAIILGAIPATFFRFAAVLGIIGACISGAYLLCDGAFLIASRLSPQNRLPFTIVVALAVPIVLSLYFLKGTEVVTFHGIFGQFSPWLLLPVLIISYAGWAASQLINFDNPIRAFLIAALVLWGLSWYGYTKEKLGWASDDCDYEEGICWVSDDDDQDTPKHPERFFGQYLIYVAIAYGTMCIKIARDRPAKPERR
jgi:hypothetical protein